MYYDTLTLSAVADELRTTVLDGRVQRIVQPSALAVQFELYAGERHQVLLSAEASDARIVLLSERLRRGIEAPSPLQLLLRKYVQGARLVQITQPRLERVLRLSFLGEHGAVDLICEIMGRHSNVILLDAQGVVMDALKRVPPSVNRYRSILPRGEYVPPPPQDKEDPLQLTTAMLGPKLAGSGERLLWRALLASVGGISPILAREIVFRATGRVGAEADIDDPTFDRLIGTVEELLSLPETHAWRPCIALDELVEGHAIAYAAYPLTHYRVTHPAASISTAIEGVLAAREALDPYREARARLAGLLAQTLERQRRKADRLRESLRTAAEAESLQREGNAILAMAWAIGPGQTDLVVLPEEVGLEGQDPLRITLDAALSPSDNAQVRFRRYRKMQAATEEVPALLEAAELEVRYLEQAATDIALASNRQELDDLEGELHATGHLSGRSPTGRVRATGRPLVLEGPDGMQILIGRNSRENDLVTFRLAGPNDLWLHAHRVPGSHVIIRSGGSAVHEETLQLAARAAVRYSAARGEASAQVDVTERRHVRRIKGARPGMVTYTQEQTLVVTADEESPPDDGESLT
jgi:predicted ribosome quality control (RQC) complex YloA/Tae2 family protein